ncbi:MAG: Calx-beta domain-containing protein [Cyanobacteriota bacterium]|nr:Calx-beta domain-containing protein [Cyanobacteriota bacterium]
MARIQDTLTGGNSFIEGTIEDDIILGLDGDDTLIGLAGGDILRGGTENDFLDGGLGDDILSGGRGSNQLIGGEGGDLFIVRLLSDDEGEDDEEPSQNQTQIQTILDFEDGIDRIGLAGNITFEDLEIVSPTSDTQFFTEVRQRSTGETLVRIAPSREPLQLDASDFTPVDILEFSQPVFQVNEDGTPVMEVTVVRNLSSGHEIGATVIPSDGTATTAVGADYFPVPIDLRFEADETVKTIAIPIADDRRVEPTETINLTLENPTGGARFGLQNTAVVEILDNDTAIEFSASDFSQLEDGTPVEAVTVVRTGGLEEEARVTVVSSDGTAVFPEDYTNTPIEVTFAPGEARKTIALPIQEDTRVEGNETVNLSLVDSTPGISLGDRSTATLTIIDNDAALEFERPIFQVREDGTEIAAVTVRRVGRTDFRASATLALTDGTAVAPFDYNNDPPPIEVVFEPGETEKTVAIDIANDTDIEPTETINLTLVDPSPGIGIGAANVAILEIVDDDEPSEPPDPPEPPEPPTSPAGSLQFGGSSFLVTEEGTPFAAVTVVRTDGSAGEVRGTIVPTNGSAIAGLDFDGTPIEVTFADGETSKVVDIPIINDTLVEVAETLNLALVDPQGGAMLGAQNTAILTIARSDLPAVLDFEGIDNLDPVTDFYGDRGIFFSGNALGIQSAHEIVESGEDDDFAGNFDDSIPGETALTYAEGDTIVMDIIAGFDSQLSFSYSSPFREQTVSIYDGFGGMGNLLGTLNLSMTTAGEFPNAYSNLESVTLPFSGTALSVAFGSVANKIVIDDIILG